MKAAQKESGDNLYLTILAVIAVLALGTFIHEAFLHGIIALINGWTLDSFTYNLMTGQTVATATAAQAARTSTFMFWLFFMFPGIIIYAVTFIIAIIKPERPITVAGIILLALNLASFNPQINGSDSYNAVQFLMTRGWAESRAYIFQFLLLGAAILILSLYLYVVIENNEKDARKRAESII